VAADHDTWVQIPISAFYYIYLWNIAYYEYFFGI